MSEQAGEERTDQVVKVSYFVYLNLMPLKDRPFIFFYLVKYSPIKEKSYGLLFM